MGPIQCLQMASNICNLQTKETIRSRILSCYSRWYISKTTNSNRVRPGTVISQYLSHPTVNFSESQQKHFPGAPPFWWDGGIFPSFDETETTAAWWAGTAVQRKGCLAFPLYAVSIASPTLEKKGGIRPLFLSSRQSPGKEGGGFNRQKYLAEGGIMLPLSWITGPIWRKAPCTCYFPIKRLGRSVHGSFSITFSLCKIFTKLAFSYSGN